MTITIELTPTEEAALRAQAERRGQEPESLLREIMRAGLAPAPEHAAATEEDHERLVERLMAAGLMTSRPARPLAPPPPPVEVLGEPLSETVVAGRR